MRRRKHGSDETNQIFPQWREGLTEGSKRRTVERDRGSDQGHARYEGRQITVRERLEYERDWALEQAHAWRGAEVEAVSDGTAWELYAEIAEDFERKANRFVEELAYLDGEAE